ncbi:glycoside hydrolase family 11 protein [Paenibacillus kribbensis]|uniref:glycoside hydrolase family 11 protein n=1 Tax=Paenibacillus kribbensis TaxID=172713 RepID=UPI002DBFD8D4|nr:glycoside hydrolase family 11 protein [Paenibacillus kribbensis]MEC0233019.1 glycoside hydrolase family 11 protein [Paenibacillus kribbensis]
MKQKRMRLFLAILICFSLTLPAVTAQAATTITSNQSGTQDGYYYELWKDSGTTSMTLNSGGTFSAQWSNIGNALFRKGKKFNETQTHQQIGNISVNYSANYQPNGNSYLCVYGWTVDPLVEYYIVDSWGSWRPPGATSKGTITVDGGTYDIYETIRVNQPSIKGNATFKQYWSVRTSKRTSGTISVSEHFKKWESLGMTMGKMYETSLTVEGYQSSGSATVTSNTITIGGSSGGGTTPPPSTATKVEAESMTKGGQYTGNISSPFNGVALYANNDLVKYTQYFESGTHSFSLRGASNNSNMARVDLKIGGQTKGTFYFGGSNPAVYTLNNVSHGTGNQEIELVVTADNGTWDAYIDYLEIN